MLILIFALSAATLLAISAAATFRSEADTTNEHLRVTKAKLRAIETDYMDLRDVVQDVYELMQPLVGRVNTERIVDRCFIEVYARLYHSPALAPYQSSEDTGTDEG